MRAKTLVCGLVLLASGLAGAADMKIGFVNTERVFREAAPAKRAQQALEREFSQRNSELGRIEKQGRDLQTELERENVTIPEAQLKIGFVNTEKVFREAAPAKRAQQVLEREFSARNAELGRIEKQGRDLQTELEKENVTMPEAARREKERQLADISRNFQRIQREIREDLNLRRNEELAKVQERATRVINQIAEQDKFDLIIQEAVFASSRIDITDKVIKALADK